MASDKTGQMKRQRSKFIYEFLPYNTFNHSNTRLSGQIRYIRPYEDEFGNRINDPNEELPKSYVIGRLHSVISQWSNSEKIRSSLDMSGGQSSVVFVNPGGAKYNVFPMTFECDDCDSIRHFKNKDLDGLTDASASSTLTCEACGGRFTESDQLSIVGACECGALAPMHIQKHCGVGMRLDRAPSQMKKWQWECVECGKTIPFVKTTTYCPNYDCDNKDMEIMNHMASRSYYSQVETLINVNPVLDVIYGDEKEKSRSDKIERAGIVSAYLRLGGGVTEPTEQEIETYAATEIFGGWEEYGNQSWSEKETAKEMAEEQLREGIGNHEEQIKDKLSEDFEDKQWSYKPDPDSEREIVYEQTTPAVAEKIYEFLSGIPDAEEYSPTDEMQTISYQEMVDTDCKDTHISTPVAKRYNKWRQCLGFSEIRLLKNFPIRTVSYGYTRLQKKPEGEEEIEGGGSMAPDEADEGDTKTDDEPDEPEEDESEPSKGTSRDVQLNLFIQKGEDGYRRPHLYTQKHNAEAVLVRLDQRTVIKWLLENDVISETQAPDLDDPEALRYWFISHVIPPNRYDDLPVMTTADESEVPKTAPPGHPLAISRHCYSLLNTMAHLFINNISTLAGHQRESLKERLLAPTMSFIVYRSPDADFALGTLWTLFEDNFKQFFTQFNTEINNCSYDPVCLHAENGACEDCLYLPAFTTENTNHNLGRATVYGGPFDNNDSNNSDTPFEDLIGFTELTMTADCEE